MTFYRETKDNRSLIKIRPARQKHISYIKFLYLPLSNASHIYWFDLNFESIKWLILDNRLASLESWGATVRLSSEDEKYMLFVLFFFVYRLFKSYGLCTLMSQIVFRVFS